MQAVKKQEDHASTAPINTNATLEAASATATVSVKTEQPPMHAAGTPATVPGAEGALASSTVGSMLAAPTTPAATQGVSAAPMEISSGGATSSVGEARKVKTEAPIATVVAATAAATIADVGDAGGDARNAPDEESALASLNDTSRSSVCAGDGATRAEKGDSVTTALVKMEQGTTTSSGASAAFAVKTEAAAVAAAAAVANDTRKNNNAAGTGEEESDMDDDDDDDDDEDVDDEGFVKKTTSAAALIRANSLGHRPEPMPLQPESVHPAFAGRRTLPRHESPASGRAYGLWDPAAVHPCFFGHLRQLGEAAGAAALAGWSGAGDGGAIDRALRVLRGLTEEKPEQDAGKLKGMCSLLRGSLPSLDLSFSLARSFLL